MRRHACAEGFKESFNEGKGHLELEIFKGPPAGPGMEKERKGVGMHDPVKNVEGFLLRFPRLGPEGPHKFNVNRVI